MEPPQTNEPVPKVVWLLLALAPAPLITIAMRDPQTIQLVGFGINPLLSCIGSFQLVRKPGLPLYVTIPTAIFLGAGFCVLNFIIGAFAGCAFGGFR